MERNDYPGGIGPRDKEDRADVPCSAYGKIPMTNDLVFGTGSIRYERSVNLDPEFYSNCGVRLEPEPEIMRFLL